MARRLLYTSAMADSPVPAWKFWHPLPFWQVLLIALACQLAVIIPIVALEQLAGIHLGGAPAGGGGGLLMFFAVRGLAKRKLEANTAKP